MDHNNKCKAVVLIYVEINLLMIAAKDTRIENSKNETPTVPEQRNIELSLYHTHIPKLEKADIVEYDNNQGTIHPAPNFVTLIQFLENVREDDLPWSDQ